VNIKSACHDVTGIKGLMLIPGGAAEKDSTEWFESKKLNQLFLDLKVRSDLVILESPSVEIADALVFASKVDAVLMAIYSGQTPANSAQDTLRKFLLIGANVLGAVLNRKVQPRIIVKNILPLAKIKLQNKGKDIYSDKSKTEKAPVSLS
jgi:Mrp family chromosome partitioning ATPase